MGDPGKKLFLLDAFALIYRAYFAFGNNQRYNSKGLNTSAILGFTNTLREVLEKQQPTHIAVVFDAPAVTNRELEYSDYKANREEMPEDIRSALPYIKRLIEAYNIPILLADGYEADDIIGTLAKRAEKEGFTTYMMTPDKDFGQLVSENIFMFKPARGGNPPEVWGVKEVCEKFEIKDPLQVIDILGLWGDAVDNIPGIPGIGEKTAKKLIAQYGSVEGLIEHSDELKGKQKENVINFAEQGILSKSLATIILDAPVEFNPDELKLTKPNKDKLKELFSELEFRNLAKRILGEDLSPASTLPASGTQMDMFSDAGGNETEEIPKEFKNLENTKHEYRLADTAEKRAILIEQLTQQKDFCFDTETTGLDTNTAELIGISFAIRKHDAWYVNMPEDQQETQNILNEFKSLFENEKIGKTGHNIKYDISIIKRYGVEVKGSIFDTMLAHYLIQPDLKHSMDFLSETYLHYSPVPIVDLIGKKGKNQLSMRDVELTKLKEYAAEDADITLQLKENFEPKLVDHLKKLFDEIEIPLIKVLADMESEGINLDTESLKKFSKELATDVKKVESEILELAGREFNIASPKQLGEILFDVLKIDEKAKKTKTGQYSTSEDVLSRLVSKHPIIEKVLDFRSMQKLKSTYVDALPALINPNTNRIHTSYFQAVAATGRLSSNSPNLQNIPIRSDKGKEVRRAFVARDKGHKLLAADYSQIELRIIAELSGDKAMQQAFIDNVDIHSATAAKVYGVSLEEVTEDQRRNAKMVNFGIIYGISAFGLSQRLNIPRKEAKEIIDNYFEQYPSIRSYMDNNIEIARAQGYVETIMGRRRYLKDINSGNAIVRGYAERNAINAPIQGSAADIIKIAMINIHNDLKAKKMKTRMLLQVHDELIFDVPLEELETLKPIVKNGMQNAVKMKVPLVVEMDAADNWLDAH